MPRRPDSQQYQPRPAEHRTVGRLVCFGDPLGRHDISGDARPLEGDERPDGTLLTYAHRTPRLLGADRDTLHLIEGPDPLQDHGGLSTESLHPMDHGMSELAHCFADRLRAIEVA